MKTRNPLFELPHHLFVVGWLIILGSVALLSSFLELLSLNKVGTNVTAYVIAVQFGLNILFTTTLIYSIVDHVACILEELLPHSSGFRADYNRDLKRKQCGRYKENKFHIT